MYRNVMMLYRNINITIQFYLYVYDITQ